MKLLIQSIGILSLLFVSSVADAARPRPVGSELFVAQDAKVWSEPSRFGVPLALLKTGLKLRVLEYSSSQKWVKVETPSGREGWILLRLTTQSQRRTLPANTQWGEVSQGTTAVDRNPAGLDVEEADRKPASTVTADAGSGDSSSTLELTLAPEYMNQLTRENANGFGFHLQGLWRLSANGALGPAISWHRFSTSVTDNTYTVARSSHRLSAELLYRWRYSDFRFDVGLGYALDRSTISTTENSSGAEVPNTSTVTYNGSGSESSVSMRLNPRYIFPVSRGIKLGVHFAYLLDWGLGSGEGNFVEEGAVSPPYHYIGGGLSLSVDL